MDCGCISFQSRDFIGNMHFWISGSQIYLFPYNNWFGNRDIIDDIRIGRKGTGWEDLVGVVVFLEFSVIGIALGIIAELGAFFVRLIWRKKV